MTIGDKNRRIEIWKRDGSLDEYNQPNPDSWALHKARWANIKGESGLGSIRSSAAAGVNTPLDRYSFRVNYDPSITVEMQIREKDGTYYNIVAVRHDKANREWTDIVGETGGSDG